MIPLISHLARVVSSALEDLAVADVKVPDATVGIVAGEAVHFASDPPDCWEQVKACAVSGEASVAGRVTVVPVAGGEGPMDGGEGVAAVIVLEGEPLPTSSQRLLSRLVAAELASARRLADLEMLVRDYTSSELADVLLSGPPGHRSGALRDLTVLFADLRGFTRFSEKTASEVVVSYLNQLFNPAIAIVQDHGGTVSNLMGDAILATFGALGDRPDHPYLAARAALMLTTSFADAHPDMPRFGVGVNTGKAYVGNIGGARRRVFTIIGDTVNLAARLESRTDPGTVTIGEETYRTIRPLAEVEPLGRMVLKGVEQPVDAFRLLGLNESWLSSDTQEMGGRGGALDP